MKWRDWRQHIAVRCDVLTQGMTPPIALQEVFARCHVKKVVFQPLLVEAAFAVDDDGFVVFVNCDGRTRAAYQLAFDNPEQKGRYLPGRIRFSLAHELIHTFFYDTTKHPYANRLNGTSAKEIESLESACNFGASHLLLPTKSLRSDTGRRDVLSVDGITELAKTYQVSIQCLITRLERLEEWTPKRGLVVLVRQDADGFRVKATAKSVAVRKLFEKISVGAECEEVFGKAPFETIVRQIKGTLDFDLTYSRQGGFGVAKCKIEYRRIESTPQAFILALSVDDQPETTSIQERSNNAEHHIAKLRDVIKQRNTPGRKLHHVE